MSLTVFLAVILAAALHATWNALVKGGRDRLLNLSAVVLGHVVVAVPALAFVPLPSAASLPYLFAGVALHFGYQLFLLKSYEAGDLTQVYPIARGSAPLIVAGVSIVWLGETLAFEELLAVMMIGLGIISLALVRQADGLRNRRAAGFALTTGCFIAAYSIVDGIGARQSGTALGFFAVLATLNAVLMAGYLWAHSPDTFSKMRRKSLPLLVFGGCASFTAYALVIWAFTQAPIALVTALRETSIIFALVIGVVFLKERLSLLKLASTFCTLSGAVLLKNSN